jgi:hypothetical protein
MRSREVERAVRRHHHGESATVICLPHTTLELVVETVTIRIGQTETVRHTVI